MHSWEATQEAQRVRGGAPGSGSSFHAVSPAAAIARALAAAGETAWKLLPLPGAPPLTRFASWVASQECTLDDHRARVELGYTPVTSRVQGMRELRDAV